MIKGGAQQQTVFDTIEFYLHEGLTVSESISEVESILRCQLPEHIVNLIKQKFG